MNAPLFITNLVLVVLSLGLTIHAGLRRRRRRHYWLVGSTLVLLGLAIVQAELFGQRFEFERLRLWVHLGFAAGALASLPGVAWSGRGLARERVRRVVHRRWVSVFVGLTGMAVLSAVWMFFTATEPVPSR